MSLRPPIQFEAGAIAALGGFYFGRNAAGEPILKFSGDGAPVDGTSGTGKSVAGKGSEYTDGTNANLYINGNTAASPLWKLVTRAA